MSHPLSVTRKLLCAAYAAIAALALFGTWHQNVTYFGSRAGNALLVPVLATIAFWKDTFATPASASITIDLFLFGLAVIVFMILEARRLGVRFVWLYLLVGMLVAISVSFPLFMIARELRLNANGESREALSMTREDALLLLIFGGPAIVLTLWSLWR